MGSVLATLYLSLTLVGAILFTEHTLHLPRKAITQRGSFEQTISKQFGGRLTDVVVRAPDGADLSAWYVEPQHWNGSEVILLHGVTDNREGVAGYSLLFLKNGYAVLLPDSRAHGESGGEIATYGVLERNDVRTWAAWLRSDSQGCIYIFGESMGAAIALQATPVTPGVCATVAESSFSTLREIAYDRFSQTTGLGLSFSRAALRPMLETALLYARLRYRVNLAEASPERSVMATHVPVLLIDGLADHNIPPRHSRRIIQAAGTQDVLWEVAGADHGGAVSKDANGFERRVLAWVATHRAPVR